MISFDLIYKLPAPNLREREKSLLDDILPQTAAETNCLCVYQTAALCCLIRTQVCLAPGFGAFPVLIAQSSAVLCAVGIVPASRACCTGAAFIACASLKVLSEIILQCIVGQQHGAGWTSQTTRSQALCAFWEQQSH